MNEAALNSIDWHAVLWATIRGTNTARAAEAKLRMIAPWHDIDPGPFLANLAASRDEICSAATGALFRLCPAPRLILPRLVDLLEHETSQIRIRALQLMAVYGSFCRPYLNQVVALVQTDDPLCQDAALRVLINIGPLSSNHVRLFAPYCVPDPNEDLHQRGIPFVGQVVDAMGPRAAALLPILEEHGWQHEVTFITECLTYPIEDFTQNVAIADNQTRNEEYRTRLDRQFRIARFFGDVGAPPDAVYGTLIAQLGDMSTMSAESAAQALAQLGNHGAAHKNAYATAMHAARVAYENWDRSNFVGVHYGRHIAGHLKIGLHHVGAIPL